MPDGAPLPPPDKRRPARWRGVWRQLQRLPLTMMCASLLAGLGIVQLTFQVGNSVYRSVTWSRETHEIQARIRALEHDVKILQEAEVYSSTPEYLREQARCNGYVGNREKVIVARDAARMTSEPCKVVRLP